MAEPGWYDDPKVPGQKRFFDGTQWTEQTASSAVSTQQAPERDGTNWQYHIVNIGMFGAADRMAASFGILGSQGWELVSIYDKSSNWIKGGENGFAIFKRAVPTGVEPDEPWGRWQHAHDVTDATTEAREQALGPNPTRACQAASHSECKRRWCTCQCHRQA